MFSLFKKRKANRIIAQTRDNYNAIAEHFNDTRHASWPEFEHFKHLVKNGQKILDWGCGNGRYFESVKDKKIKYYGLDISSGLIGFAKQKYQSEIESGKVDFFCTEKGEINFPKNFFDICIMIASFHHLPSDEVRLVLLKKVYKELKSGGHLIMTNWNLESKWGKDKVKKPGWKKLGDSDFIVPWKNQDGEIITKRYYHSFKKTELKKLLHEAGFKIEKLEYFNKERWSDEKKGRNLVTIAIKE